MIPRRKLVKQMTSCIHFLWYGGAFFATNDEKGHEENVDKQNAIIYDKGAHALIEEGKASLCSLRLTGLSPLLVSILEIRPSIGWLIKAIMIRQDVRQVFHVGNTTSTNSFNLESNIGCNKRGLSLRRKHDGR
jgi:hypothetical protein